MPDFSFITYAGMPDLDPDDRLAVDALAARGFRTQAAVWDDPRIDWASAGICVIRSTWDYYERRDAFVAWAYRVAAVTQLWNPPDVVRWNTHKSYLRSLAAKGIGIVPTEWIAAGSRADIAAVLHARGWKRAIVKPAIGLATFGVKLVEANPSFDAAAAQEHLDRLFATGDAMVQPYVESVEDYGERALIFIDGEFTHAARKAAFQDLLPAGQAGETPVTASSAEIELAESVMSAIGQPALYARVDLVRDADDRPLVIEVELVEPSLFLSMHPPAVERLADALSKLKRTRRKARKHVE